MEKNKRESTLSTLELITKELGVSLSVLVFLASQDCEVKELEKPEIEELSDSIMRLMDIAYRQKTLL